MVEWGDDIATKIRSFQPVIFKDIVILGMIRYCIKTVARTFIWFVFTADKRCVCLFW